MSHKDLIVRVFRGHVLPENFIDRASAAFPNAFGAASVVGGKLMVKTFDKIPSKEQLTGLVNGFKDQDLILHFGQSADGYSDGSIQPFCLLEGPAQEDHLVAFLAGDFSNHGEPTSPHSDAHFAVEKMLRPMVAEKLQLAGGDFAKLLESFRTVVFNHTIKHVGITPASIVLLPYQGEALIFNDGPKAYAFPEFWTSDHLGLLQAPAEQVQTKVEVDPFTAAMNGGSAPVVEPQKAPTSVPITAPAQPDAAPPGNKEGPTGEPLPGDEVVVTPPAEVGSDKKQISLFYRVLLNDVPSAYRQKPAVKVNKALYDFYMDCRRQKFNIQSHQKLLELFAARNNQAAAPAAAPTSAAATQKASTSTAAIAAAQGANQPVAPKGEDVVWPHLTAEEKSRFDDMLKQEMFKRMANSPVVKDIFEPQKVLDARGSEGMDVAVQMGIKGGLNGTSNWTYAALRELGLKVGVNALAVLCSNWIHRALTMETVLETATHPGNKTEVKATGTDNAAPAPAPTPAPAAPARSISNKYANMGV